MNKRRADLKPGDRIHNVTLLTEGMVVRLPGATFHVGKKIDPAPAFEAVQLGVGPVQWYPQRTVCRGLEFVGWTGKVAG